MSVTGPVSAKPNGASKNKSRENLVRLPSATAVGAFTQRPPVIVGAFALLTLGLIFLQPSQRTEPLASIDDTTQAPSLEVTRAATAPISIAPEVQNIEVRTSLRPVARPTTQTPANTVVAPEQVAVTAPNQSAAAPEAQQNASLFGELAQQRSNLLTTTARTENGELQPSLGSLAYNTKIYPAEEAVPALSLHSLDINSDRSFAPDATSPSPVSKTRTGPNSVFITWLDSREAPQAEIPTRASTTPIRETVVAPTSRIVTANATFTGNTSEQEELVPLEGVTDIVASLATPESIGNAELRAKLAAAPTRAVHTVRLGDSLLTLALRYYRDGDKAEMILEANRRHLGDGGELVIGQILRIPDIDNL